MKGKTHADGSNVTQDGEDTVHLGPVDFDDANTGIKH